MGMNIILTDENFDAEVANSDKLVLVDFFAIWCEPCAILAPVLDRVANDLKEKVVLLKADLANIPKTAGKFGVEKIPTVILFKNGKPISGFVGLASEQSIKEWIERTTIEPDINAAIERYDNYAKANGFRLNPDTETVERIVKGLYENQKKYGKKYCPCRRISGNEEEDMKKICPCAFHKEEIERDGHCFCNLFVKY